MCTRLESPRITLRLSSSVIWATLEISIELPKPLPIVIPPPAPNKPKTSEWLEIQLLRVEISSTLLFNTAWTFNPVKWVFPFNASAILGACATLTDNLNELWISWRTSISLASWSAFKLELIEIVESPPDKVILSAVGDSKWLTTSAPRLSSAAEMPAALSKISIWLILLKIPRSTAGLLAKAITSCAVSTASDTTCTV